MGKIIVLIGEITDPFEGKRDKKKVETLAEDISKHGLKCPLLVDVEYVIIDGSHRLGALQKLGWKEVSIEVINLKEMQQPHP